MFAILADYLSHTAGGTQRRTPRSAFQLAAIIKCVTGRSSWDFYGYGCWCGLGGEGQTVDSLDECCKRHDECYQDLVNSKVCSTMDLYLGFYHFNRRHCEEKSLPTISCDDAMTACKISLCECDLQVALCFAKNQYNPKNAHYNRKFCLP
ncbi:phospholipase A2 A2-actitoxin-Cgg2a-like [Diadema antillarum]|uniref:phospholipase A2 A2-actitoxin-Cgg2a-like n=1 Tax=Diadema antillarum TaxID=105358 RepID=UPI003A898D7E